LVKKRCTPPALMARAAISESASPVSIIEITSGCVTRTSARNSTPDVPGMR
jgi:hypothetical protein